MSPKRSVLSTLIAAALTAENGIEQEAGRAAIWEVNPKRSSHRIYATGLRNPNGLAWEPDGEAFGRPVGVALDKHSALLVADDVGNIIWRVTASPMAPGSMRVTSTER